MNLTLSDLLQCSIATLCFFVLFVPAGYLVGWWSDLLRFRSRSSTEQALWSCALSVPLSLVLANVLGRWLPASGVLATFLAFDLGAAALLVSQWRQRARRPLVVLDRYTKIVLICVAAELLYVWFSGLPWAVHHKIFEPVFSSDWEIRLPLVRASSHSGVPPPNPFFTFRGQSPPMRYYFYWYPLCAQVVRLIHTDARATLLASSCYAALAIVSILFLYAKYMTQSAAPLRQRCVLLLATCCVLGLDVLPSALGLFVWRNRIRPEIEWWTLDRSPGLQGALIFAPHHVAGAVCGLLGFLVFALLSLREETRTRRAIVVHGFWGAVAFAALAGTSTFLVLFFALACAVLLLDRLWHRQYAAPLAVLLATVLSLSLSAPYLRDMLAKTPGASTVGTGKHLLGLALRHNDHAHAIVRAGGKHFFHRADADTGLQRFVYRAVVLPLFYVVEFGFYGFVVVWQFRRNFLQERLSPQVRALWLLAFSVGFFFLFVTSSPIQYVNDLGVHAGLVLRLIFAVWGSEMLAWYLRERKSRSWTPAQVWTIRLATACFVLGVTMSVWQGVVDRIYLVLLDRQAVPADAPFPRVQHVASVYKDVFDAEQVVAHQLPANAVVQSNPLGRLQTLFRLYGERREAAGDQSCEGNFGGDPRVCKAMVSGFFNLFGAHPKVEKGKPRITLDPAGTSVPALQVVCAQNGLAAVLATRYDPVWYVADGWVWRGDLLYGNGTVRVIRCPVATAGQMASAGTL